MGNQTNAFSPENICQVLVDQELMTKETRRAILRKYESQRKWLAGTMAGRSQLSSADELEGGVSPIEVLASFKLVSTDPKGGVLTEDAITNAMAKSLNIEYKKINPVELDLDAVTKIIPKPFAIKYLTVPLDVNNGILKLAMYNPLNRVALEDVRRVTNLTVAPVMASKSDIEKLISEFYDFQSSIKAAESKISSVSIDLGNLEQYVKLSSISEITSSDEHIKRAVDYLFQYALEQRASDIHIEPKRDNNIIRFRIDGVLHTIYKLPKMVHPAIISRIKNLSRLDIAEKRRPQDGRIKIRGGDDKEAEVRVSTIPVAFGEKAVLRILKSEVLMQDLRQLGFSPSDLVKFRSFIERPHGIILVTGPTGSGKSTTLYSALRYLSTSEKNITTVEEPIEMIHEDFNQIAVNRAIDLTFANVLRYILRQDPDIIMVGEIRDKEAGDNAIQAALTGHLVLSTLHTNDAPSSVTRLIDLGVEPFLITSTLVGIVAQRLVRRICPHCIEAYEAKPNELKVLGLEIIDEPVILKRGAGCIHCKQTGYLGRIAIFEVMPISESIRKQVTTHANLDVLRQTAVKEGMVSLRQSAIDKMLDGTTTLTEVVRVTHSDVF
ncbi:MAG: type II/IV secretion system protein [Deltaproteobacteria bacterium]|nr:type II/IV secretion system protein [Deltaproteobacteria bacterium]